MVDFKKIKKKLTVDNIIDIMATLNAQPFNTNNKIIEFTSICHSSNSHKLWYYIDTQSFYCHRCAESYDIFSIVSKIKKWSLFESSNFIIDKAHLDLSKVQVKTLTSTSDNWKKDLFKYSLNTIPEIDLQVHNEDVLMLFEDIYHQSFIDDGISIETMQKYGLKYYLWKQQIVIPIRDEYGRLVGLQSRNTLPEVIQAGYKYIPTRILNGTEYNFPTSQVCYGLDINAPHIIKKKEIILTEGIKSVLQAESFIEENNTTAIFGMNFNKYRRNMVLYYGITDVVIALDKQYQAIFDEQGRYTEDYVLWQKKVMKIVKLFSGLVNVYVVYDVENILDYKNSPFDKGKEVWEYLYKERELIEC